MTIFKRALDILPDWLWPRTKKTDPSHHLLDAHASIQALLNDAAIPRAVREEMAEEFRAIEDFSRKLDGEEIHIAAFGRVSVGKSSLLNALLNQDHFSTSPLHGETRQAQRTQWESFDSGGVVLIDTPGIDELDGAQREQLAQQAASRADLILFVCDGDLTRQESKALEALALKQRPILLVLNKSDRYSEDEVQRLLLHLRQQSQHLNTVREVFPVSASPRPVTVISRNPNGTETESQRQRPVDVSALRLRLWQILEQEGKTLSALNAALFATELDQQIAARMLELRKDLADRIVRNYSIAKGLLVAVNPVPVADLLAAAGTDVGLITHLGRVYGFQLNRREAGGLLFTISAQLAALMGAYWGVNLVSSALKGISAGLSTTVTAGAQGALAYYATYLVGRAAESYFLAGRSWGPDGAKTVIRSIVDSLERDSILRTAREDILKRLQLT